LLILSRETCFHHHKGETGFRQLLDQALVVQIAAIEQHAVCAALGEVLDRTVLQRSAVAAAGEHHIVADPVGFFFDAVDQPEEVGLAQRVHDHADGLRLLEYQ
jgi:hypothetical protein